MDTNPSPDVHESEAPYNPVYHESTSNAEIVAVLVVLIFTLVLLTVVTLMN